jgi:hypothetical protein
MAVVEYLGQPTTLFRYRSLSNFDREIETLAKKYIYCSPYTQLNDPMEGRFRKRSSFSRSASGKRYIAAINATLPNLGIGSFCEVGNHTLMWAHYADQFRGICIAYRFRKLLEHLSDSIVLTRISYSDRTPVLRRAKPNQLEVAKTILSRKSRSWLYEREWRMFAGVGAAKYRSKDCVSHVLLGSRMDAKVRGRIERELKHLKIDARDMDDESLSMAI